MPDNAKFCSTCGNKLVLPDMRENPTIVLDGKTMTAMDLTQYCLERRYFWFKDFAPEVLRKNIQNQFRIFFENIIQNIQDDETPLLCFTGEYNKDSILDNGGVRAFLLTDKRLLSSSWYDKLFSWKYFFDMSILWKAHSKKSPRCSLLSIYVRDLVNVEPTMISGHDAIIFHKTDGDFYVKFYCNNTTHALCGQLNEILKDLKEKELSE